MGSGSVERLMDKWDRLRQRSTSSKGLLAAADNEGPRVSSLRSKDMASIHEHGQGKLFPACAVKERCHLAATKESSARRKFTQEGKLIWQKFFSHGCTRINTDEGRRVLIPAHLGPSTLKRKARPATNRRPATSTTARRSRRRRRQKVSARRAGFPRAWASSRRRRGRRISPPARG